MVYICIYIVTTVLITTMHIYIYLFIYTHTKATGPASEEETKVKLEEDNRMLSERCHGPFNSHTTRKTHKKHLEKCKHIRPEK